MTTTYNEYSEEGAGAALLTTILIFFALVLGIISLTPVWAWEEQLNQCAIRGIPTNLCPDDESYVGVPYNPPQQNYSGGFDNSLRSSNSGRSTFTKWVWVYKETTFYNPEDKICYTAYHRRVQYHKNNVTTITNFPNVAVAACLTPYVYSINLVFDQ